MKPTNSKKPIKHPCRLGCRLVMLIFLSTAAGCVNQQHRLAASPPPSGQQALEKGLEIFQTADYRRALAALEPLQHSHDRVVARQAKYAVACIRLLLAERPREYLDALHQWQAWSRMAPLKYTGEDPRLLGPLIQRQAPGGSAWKRSTGGKKAAGWQLRGVPLAKYRAREKEVRRLKARIKAMQEQKPLWEYYVRHTAELENEIWNLKHKINRLEAIDQKIQQKKKELSSP